MKFTFTFILLLIFFGGGFYLGQKSKEKKIESLQQDVALLKLKMENAEENLREKKEELKARLQAAIDNWEEKKKEIDILERKIEENIRNFSRVLNFQPEENKIPNTVKEKQENLSAETETETAENDDRKD
jgi:hypothetical protein